MRTKMETNVDMKNNFIYQFFEYLFKTSFLLNMCRNIHFLFPKIIQLQLNIVY